MKLGFNAKANYPFAHLFSQYSFEVQYITLGQIKSDALTEAFEMLFH